MLNKLVPSLRKSVRKRMARLLWPSGHGVVRRDGVLYLLDLQNHKYDKYILQWGVAEREQRAFFLENIRRRNCGTFLDIGANFGTYAACVALQTNCKTIIAYEPDRRSYDRLRAHLLLNGLTETRAGLLGEDSGKKIVTRFVAVSDHNGTVPLVLTPESSQVAEEGSTGNTVPAVRLDDELPISGQRIALKIDVDFHELAVLQGMKSLLRYNDCFLQVECLPDSAPAFIEAMKAEGYQLLHQISEDHYFAKKE
jgi:FkbM family methyltransferase